MNMDDKEPNYNVFNGDSVLIPHVTFSRKGVHYCIYCGNVSDTREHIPSKVFLSKPYPDDLPVLPACKKCNNGFSDDELYTEIYIDSIKYLSGFSNKILNENEQHIFCNSAFPDAQTDLSSYYDIGKIPTRERIERIITKLAIGHAVYELSTGYFSNSFSGKPISIKYNFLFETSKTEKEEFDSLIIMDDKVLPEIGSRVYGKLLVLEQTMQSLNGNDTKKLQIPIMNWSDIQDKRYRYIAWLETNNTFHVKIVIHDFLFAEVIFKLD